MDGSGDSFRVVEPALEDCADISGCILTDRETILFRIVSLLFHLDAFEHDNHLMHELLLQSLLYSLGGPETSHL